MKKFTFGLFLLFAFNIASAQLFEIKGIGIGYMYLGPKLGGNISFASNTSYTGSSTSINGGLQIGGVARLGITKKIAIQPELVYTSRGYSNKDDFGKNVTNYRYIGLPIVAKYSLLAISGININAEGGFYTDVLTGVNSVYEATGYDFVEDHNAETLEPWSRVDFGFNVGAEASYGLKNGDLFQLGLRYSQGIIDTYKNDVADESQLNISLMLSCTYLFDATRLFKFNKAEE
jgi:hypothetical protein